MIRDLTVEEIPGALFLGSQFWSEAGLPGRLDPEVAVRSWSSFYDKGLGSILGYFEDGNLCGGIGYLAYPDLNDGVLVAMETFWYVDPRYRGVGLRLMKAFENRAVELGAGRLVMGRTARLGRGTLDKLYTRGGYVETETLFVKTLS